MKLYSIIPDITHTRSPFFKYFKVKRDTISTSIIKFSFNLYFCICLRCMEYFPIHKHNLSHQYSDKLCCKVVTHKMPLVTSLFGSSVHNQVIYGINEDQIFSGVQTVHNVVKNCGQSRPLVENPNIVPHCSPIVQEDK